jgi:hypothetical protein
MWRRAPPDGQVPRTNGSRAADLPGRKAFASFVAFGQVIAQMVEIAKQNEGWLRRCLSLARLIHVKRAAGRPKDLEAIAELEALREERRDQEEA